MSMVTDPSSFTVHVGIKSGSPGADRRAAASAGMVDFR